MYTNALKTLPDILSENQHPVIETRDGVKFAVVPKGMNVQSLKAIRDEDKLVPDYRSDSVTTHNLASFIEHVKRFVSPESVLFADQPTIEGNNASFEMKAVVDHHPAGVDVTKAGARKHQINYVAALHVRTARWLQNERKQMMQGDFAAFIEDNLSDLCVLEGFTPPFGSAVATPADLLTLSRGLEVRVNQTVRNHSRLSTGEVALVFTTENTRQDGSELIVPEWFGLRLPVFIGTEPIILPVRLRYKVLDGIIKFSYLFHNFDQVLEATVNQTINAVRQALPELHVVEGVR